MIVLHCRTPRRGVLAECMRLEGMAVPRTFDNASIKAAFSTVSLPGILSNVAQKKLLQSYRAQPIIATKLCTSADLSDFKENERFRLTDIGDLKPVGADGEIKEGGVSEEKAVNQLDTYAKKFCLTRKMIINDDLGAFLKVPSAMGNRAARLVDQLFFTKLLANPTMTEIPAACRASRPMGKRKRGLGSRSSRRTTGTFFPARTPPSLRTPSRRRSRRSSTRRTRTEDASAP